MVLKLLRLPLSLMMDYFLRLLVFLLQPLPVFVQLKDWDLNFVQLLLLPSQLPLNFLLLVNFLQLPLLPLPLSLLVFFRTFVGSVTVLLNLNWLLTLFLTQLEYGVIWNNIIACKTGFVWFSTTPRPPPRA